METLLKPYRVQKWLTAICIFLFWLSLGITIVIFFEPLYQWSIQWFNVEKLTGYSVDVLTKNYHQLIDYLTNPFTSTLQMSNFTSSTQGLFHFYEVKRLFFVNFAVLIISVAGAFFGLRFFKRRKQTWQLCSPIRLLIVIPIVVCVAIGSFFDTLFIQFHHVFFNNSAWIFDPKLDPIILALPEEFFMVCFTFVFLILLLGLIGTKAAIKNLKELN